MEKDLKEIEYEVGDKPRGQPTEIGISLQDEGVRRVLKEEIARPVIQEVNKTLSEERIDGETLLKAYPINSQVFFDNRFGKIIRGTVKGACKPLPGNCEWYLNVLGDDNNRYYVGFGAIHEKHTA